MQEVVTHDRGVNPGLLKAWLGVRFGNEVLNSVAQKLSPDTRDMLLNPVTNQWYPIHLMKELYQVVYDELLPVDPKALLDYGRFASERSASSLLRFLVRFIDMDTVIKRMGAFWKHYHKGGKITAGELVEVEGRRKRIIAIHGYDPGEHACIVQEGYFLDMAKRAGAKNARVEKKTCIYHGDDNCSWEVSWE